MPDSQKGQEPCPVHGSSDFSDREDALRAGLEAARDGMEQGRRAVRDLARLVVTFVLTRGDGRDVADDMARRLVEALRREQVALRALELLMERVVLAEDHLRRLEVAIEWGTAEDVQAALEPLAEALRSVPGVR